MKVLYESHHKFLFFHLDRACYQTLIITNGIEAFCSLVAQHSIRVIREILFLFETIRFRHKTVFGNLQERHLQSQLLLMQTLSCR